MINISFESERYDRARWLRMNIWGPDAIAGEITRQAMQDASQHCLGNIRTIRSMDELVAIFGSSVATGRLWLPGEQ